MFSVSFPFRLEFLGDAVLGYVVTVYLYHRHKEFDPGIVPLVMGYPIRLLFYLSGLFFFVY